METEDNGREVFENEYEYEHLDDIKKDKLGNVQVLIKWKGFSVNENTWEPITNISSPHEVIELLRDLKQKLTHKSSNKYKKTTSIIDDTIQQYQKENGFSPSKDFSNEQKEDGSSQSKLSSNINKDTPEFSILNATPNDHTVNANLTISHIAINQSKIVDELPKIEMRDTLLDSTVLMDKASPQFQGVAEKPNKRRRKNSTTVSEIGSRNQSQTRKRKKSEIISRDNSCSRISNQSEKKKSNSNLRQSTISDFIAANIIVPVNQSSKYKKPPPALNTTNTTIQMPKDIVIDSGINNKQKPNDEKSIKYKSNTVSNLNSLKPSPMRDTNLSNKNKTKGKQTPLLIQSTIEKAREKYVSTNNPIDSVGDTINNSINESKMKQVDPRKQTANNKPVKKDPIFIPRLTDIKNSNGSKSQGKNTPTNLNRGDRSKSTKPSPYRELNSTMGNISMIDSSMKEKKKYNNKVRDESNDQRITSVPMKVSEEDRDDTKEYKNQEYITNRYNGSSISVGDVYDRYVSSTSSLHRCDGTYIVFIHRFRETDDPIYLDIYDMMHIDVLYVYNALLSYNDEIMDMMQQYMTIWTSIV